MSYLIIQSRDPFQSTEAQRCYDAAVSLASQGQKVTLFLVQNGVLAARRGAQSGPLEVLSAAGVEVLADDFSLRERGIAADRLCAGVRAAPIETVVDRLAEGRKAIWH